MNSVLSQLSLLDYVLFMGILWLSGVFIWLIKKFVSSYEKNTVVMTKVQGTLEAMDRKLDTAADRDVEIIKSLAVRQPPEVKVVVPEAKVARQ